jgi:hypothetical protein
MPKKIFIESYPNDKIAWVHLEDPGIGYVGAVEVSDELYQHLVDNPIEPDSPMAELVQHLVKYGYSLGA